LGWFSDLLIPKKPRLQSSLCAGMLLMLGSLIVTAATSGSVRYYSEVLKR
jgi:hypothetical protein